MQLLSTPTLCPSRVATNTEAGGFLRSYILTAPSPQPIEWRGKSVIHIRQNNGGLTSNDLTAADVTANRQLQSEGYVARCLPGHLWGSWWRPGNASECLPPASLFARRKYGWSWKSHWVNTINSCNNRHLLPPHGISPDTKRRAAFCLQNMTMPGERTLLNGSVDHDVPPTIA